MPAALHDADRDGGAAVDRLGVDHFRRGDGEPNLFFKIQSRMCFELDQRFRSSADVKAAFG
ncbi:hypothetical protein [Streptomyces sp. GS7]|uniref:hypothetical protein n=1 Tax=Streptomyces sp. GS7 TaxID=2692234 RepID=UPI00131610D3|nr:hypothetical protein [Streptomyces sp. GS7]QHC23474.1 hypothetical protein GR130_20890 [Streptomyces sp. GS7]